MPDHFAGRSGDSDARWLLPLPGVLPECSFGHSNGQRIGLRALHQEKTSKNVIPFQNGPPLLWDGPAAASGCWADVPIGLVSLEGP